jgi:benzil reductase ((S)-benzoin forming)
MNLYIVTGPSRGLGLALCEAIARSSDNELIALGRAPDAPIPGGARIEVDLADSAALEKACDRIESRIRGRRYEKAVLINNAGIVEPVAPLEDAEADAIERNLVVNLVAPMLLMRRFLLATEGIALLRRIVNISSGAGRRPLSGWSAYCASKAGLDMATRVVALEAAARHRNVEAVSLAPGVIDTDMQATVRSQPEARFADVERFRKMKEEGALRSAASVAGEILRAEREGRLVGDAVLDLRSLAIPSE